MRMNNFVVYKNTSPDAVPMAEYCRDDNGHDWYENREKFDKEWIIGFDSSDIVCLITNDVQAINPVGLSIVDADSIPEGMSIDGSWKFDGKSFVQDESARIKKLQVKRSKLMREVSDEIAALQDAATLGNETPEEVTELQELMQYRIALKRLNLEDKNIKWPSRP